MNMIADPNTFEPASNFISILENELTWLISKRYTTQGPYKDLLETIQNIPLESPDELDHLSRQLQTKLQQLSLHVGEKFKAIIDLSIAQANIFKERMAELQRDMHDLKYHNETLGETIESLQDKLQEWEHQYDNLKLEATQMQQKYEAELKRSRKEKKELKRTFLQVQEQTQQERKLFEDLHIERQEVQQQIISEKETNQALREEVQRLRNRLEENQHKASASATKIEFQERQISKLEEEIEEKNKLISELYQAQRPKVDSMSINLQEPEQNNIYEEKISHLSLTKRITLVEKHKLGDEVHINESFDEEFKRSNSIRNSLHSDFSHEEPHEEVHHQKRLNNTIVEEEMQSSRIVSSNKIRVIQAPDIYFFHYLLTVQAVKLKMERQQALQINLSSLDLYKKMINEARFHQWDIWIEKQLSSRLQLSR